MARHYTLNTGLIRLIRLMDLKKSRRAKISLCGSEKG